MPVWGQIAMAVIIAIIIFNFLNHGDVTVPLAKDTFSGINTGIQNLEGR